MKPIIEASREVPLLCETDVVVIGGGAAGIGAALAAARTGAKTVIVEKWNRFGGSQTMTLNNSFTYTDDKIQGGIIQEIVDRLKKAGMTLESNVGTRRVHWSTDEGCYYFDKEYYMLLIDRMMKEAGVKVLFHSFATDGIVENGKLKGVIIETHQGRNAILAKSVIDCSAVSHIAWKSGASVMGEEGYTDNRFGPFQGMHMGFGYGMFLNGVDYKKYREFAEKNVEDWDYWVRGRKLFMDYREKGKLHCPRNSCLMNEYSDGKCWVLAPYYPIPKGEHPWMVENMTEAEIDLREQSWSVYEMLRDNVPGFENSWLEQTATSLMMRDGHRIEGRYVLTVDDISNQCTFDDAITCCNMPTDVFFPNGSHHHEYDVLPYDIPFRSLVSKDYPNLLGAGSTASYDLITWSATRYCTPSVCTGQAAGTAAALAAKQGIDPGDIDIKLLQKTLQKDGLVTSNKLVDPMIIDKYKYRVQTWGHCFEL